MNARDVMNNAHDESEVEVEIEESCTSMEFRDTVKIDIRNMAWNEAIRIVDAGKMHDNDIDAVRDLSKIARGQ